MQKYCSVKVDVVAHQAAKIAAARQGILIQELVSRILREALPAEVAYAEPQKSRQTA